MNPAAGSASEPVVRRVWADGFVDLLGSPSADGKYLSVVDWTTGDLAVRDLATAETRRITNKGAWTGSTEHAESSIFSPDGKQLAYAWFNSGLSYDLRLIRIDGSQPRILYRNDEARYVYPSQWAPDGRTILVLMTLKSGSNQIALVSVADGSIRILKSIGWSGPVKMGFSVDGRFIAYHAPPREDSPNRDIFILARDGSRESPAVEHPADDVLLGWAPDGRHIFFASDRTGTMSAWSLPVADGRPQGPAELVKRDLGRVWPLGFASSGAYFYGLESGVLDVFIQPFDRATGRVTGTPSKLTQRFVAMNLSPEFSPDGEHVLYVSKRTAGPPFFQQVITVQSLQTGESRDLTTELGYLQRVRWSPDGRSLLGVGQDRKNRQGIYRIDARAGTATLLVQGEADSQVAAPAWSPDGKRLFFLRTESGNKLARIVRREVDTSQETEICRTEATRLIRRMALSPDAQQVAFIMSDTTTRSSSLNVISARGGDVRTLVKVEAPDAVVTGYDILAWSPDGRHVFFAKSRDVASGQELWRVAVAGGAPEPVGLATTSIYGVAVHPAGTEIAVASGELTTEIWAMENFLPALKPAR